jgi:hypothetical protein
VHTLTTVAKSVLEKPCPGFQGIIKELEVKNPVKVGKDLPLSWEPASSFSAADYTFCLFQKET